MVGGSWAPHYITEAILIVEIQEARKKITHLTISISKKIYIERIKICSGSINEYVKMGLSFCLQRSFHAFVLLNIPLSTSNLFPWAIELPKSA